MDALCGAQCDGHVRSGEPIGGFLDLLGFSGQSRDRIAQGRFGEADALRGFENRHSLIEHEGGAGFFLRLPWVAAESCHDAIMRWLVGEVKAFSRGARGCGCAGWPRSDDLGAARTGVRGAGFSCVLA